jgi:hypothetical protein
MRAAAALLALLLAGCGAEPAAGPARTFALKFDRLAKEHGRYLPTSDIAVDVAELDGAKERIDCAGRRVTIAAVVWADLRDGSREAAVFHVLAHCLLSRGHRAGDTTTGSAITEPWSLMNPDFVPGPFYLSDVDRYIEELFVTPILNDTVYP